MKKEASKVMSLIIVILLLYPISKDILQVPKKHNIWKQERKKYSVIYIPFFGGPQKFKGTFRTAITEISE